MRINIKKMRKDAILPAYQTDGSSAMDICAAISHPRVMKPLDRILVPSGIAIELPTGYEAQIRARSGLSLKHGITLANGIGTIDTDYRGEIGVILINLSNENFTIEPGMRIAQMAIVKFYQAEWSIVEQLSETVRGDGGFGSTKLV